MERFVYPATLTPDDKDGGFVVRPGGGWAAIDCGSSIGCIAVCSACIKDECEVRTDRRIGGTHGELKRSFKRAESGFDPFGPLQIVCSLQLGRKPRRYLTAQSDGLFSVEKPLLIGYVAKRL